MKPELYRALKYTASSKNKEGRYIQLSPNECEEILKELREK